MKEEEAGSGNSSTDSVNSGSRPDYQICIPLGWALCKGLIMYSKSYSTCNAEFPSLGCTQDILT
jgi:hypothetical protein